MWYVTASFIRPIPGLSTSCAGRHAVPGVDGCSSRSHSAEHWPPARSAANSDAGSPHSAAAASTTASAFSAAHSDRRHHPVQSERGLRSGGRFAGRRWCSSGSHAASTASELAAGTVDVLQGEDGGVPHAQSGRAGDDDHSRERWASGSLR